MASFKLVHLITLVSFMNFLTAKALVDQEFLGSTCSGNLTTPNSTFHLNLRSLLSYLSSNATAKQFYNTTVASRNQSDTVYGMFVCWHNVPPQLCNQCVANATKTIFSDSYPASDCSLSNEAVYWYEDCMIRFSNHSFFSTADLSSLSVDGGCNPAYVSNSQTNLMSLVTKTMYEAADMAANSTPIGAKKYATKQARIAGFQTLYCEVQCTPDLSPQDCRKCLNVSTVVAQHTCEQGNIIWNFRNPSCNIRSDVYPFYRPAPSGLVPVTNSSNTESKNSQNTAYLSHDCSSNETINSAFLSNLRTLLSFLSSNSTTTKTGFFKTTVNTVSGLFMCRGDLFRFPTLCQLCVQNATQRISSECPSSKDAVIWYNHCLLRYSDRSSLSTVDTTPTYQDFNIVNTSNTNQQQSFFTWTLANTLSELELETDDSTIKNYATKSVKLNDHQTLYTLAQCTPDLENDYCSTCLRNIFEKEIPWCCMASPEGKVLYPSCYMMFGLSKFYRDDDQVETYGGASPSPATTGDVPTPSNETNKRVTSKENNKGMPQTIIILIVVLIVVSVVLLSFCYFLRRRKARKSSYKTLLRKNFGCESITLQGLQFDLAIIKAATNNFSHENKIGKGGFGEVYKGILSDGRHIAVKRLSTSSKQGSIEFKNEILLIAQLQHRNLVTFLGFCLKEQEKILIYEYMPNGSLDYLLFETQQQKLCWSERYKIIRGTALGILYLHEYSRLKVIHRDLKPSNVLLDENMNPKISDFGMAKIVEMDQDLGNTNRIVGTYGYMSPEYVMLGQFSEKSDVFSFGIMVLEIITGKRNINAYESHNVIEGLIGYVWRQWKNQESLSILDSNIKESYSQMEVLKCIHIGLLCVQENPNIRPTMAMIISYLNSHSHDLPFPQEPAFLLHRDRMNLEMLTLQERSSGEVANSTLFSINEMSTNS